MPEFNTKKAIDAQKKFCKEKGYPEFSNLVSGECWSCKANIFFLVGGYSVDYASNNLITGCPFCNRSFCD